MFHPFGEQWFISSAGVVSLDAVPLDSPLSPDAIAFAAANPGMFSFHRMMAYRVRCLALISNVSEGLRKQGLNPPSAPGPLVRPVQLAHIAPVAKPTSAKARLPLERLAAVPVPAAASGPTSGMRPAQLVKHASNTAALPPLLGRSSPGQQASPSQLSTQQQQQQQPPKQAAYTSYKGYTAYNSSSQPPGRRGPLAFFPGARPREEQIPVVLHVRGFNLHLVKYAHVQAFGQVYPASNLTPASSSSSAHEDSMNEAAVGSSELTAAWGPFWLPGHVKQRVQTAVVGLSRKVQGDRPPWKGIKDLPSELILKVLLPKSTVEKLCSAPVAASVTSSNITPATHTTRSSAGVSSGQRASQGVRTSPAPITGGGSKGAASNPKRSNVQKLVLQLKTDFEITTVPIRLEQYRVGVVSWDNQVAALVTEMLSRYVQGQLAPAPAAGTTVQQQPPSMLWKLMGQLTALRSGRSAITGAASSTTAQQQSASQAAAASEAGTSSSRPQPLQLPRHKTHSMSAVAGSGAAAEGETGDVNGRGSPLSSPASFNPAWVEPWVVGGGQQTPLPTNNNALAAPTGDTMSGLPTSSLAAAPSSASSNSTATEQHLQQLQDVVGATSTAALVPRSPQPKQWDLQQDQAHQQQQQQQQQQMLLSQQLSASKHGARGLLQPRQLEPQRFLSAAANRLLRVSKQVVMSRTSPLAKLSRWDSSMRALPAISSTLSMDDAYDVLPAFAGQSAGAGSGTSPTASSSQAVPALQSQQLRGPTDASEVSSAAASQQENLSQSASLPVSSSNKVNLADAGDVGRALSTGSCVNSSVPSRTGWVYGLGARSRQHLRFVKQPSADASVMQQPSADTSAAAPITSVDMLQQQQQQQQSQVAAVPPHGRSALGPQGVQPGGGRGNWPRAEQPATSAPNASGVVSSCSAHSTVRYQCVPSLYNDPEQWLTAVAAQLLNSPPNNGPWSRVYEWVRNTLPTAGLPWISAAQDQQHLNVSMDPESSCDVLVLPCVVNRKLDKVLRSPGLHALVDAARSAGIVIIPVLLSDAKSKWDLMAFGRPSMSTDAAAQLISEAFDLPVEQVCQMHISKLQGLCREPALLEGLSAEQQEQIDGVVSALHNRVVDWLLNKYGYIGVRSRL